MVPGIISFRPLQTTGLQNRGIDIDDSDNIYVTDLGWIMRGRNKQGIVNSRVETGTEKQRFVKLDSNGDFIVEFGEYGTGDGEFNFPLRIVADSNQNVYVADSENNRIQVIVRDLELDE